MGRGGGNRTDDQNDQSNAIPLFPPCASGFDDGLFGRLESAFHLRFCLLGFCFDVVDGAFLDLDHDAHFVEQLREFRYGAFNLLDILVSGLDFSQC